MLRPPSLRATSDVDLMVIGSVNLANLSPRLRRAEERSGREVNVTVYSAEEFRQKVKMRDHFLRAVLRGRKQFVKGSSIDLVEIVGEQRSPKAPELQERVG